MSPDVITLSVVAVIVIGTFVYFRSRKSDKPSGKGSGGGSTSGRPSRPQSMK